MCVETRVDYGRLQKLRRKCYTMIDLVQHGTFGIINCKFDRANWLHEYDNHTTVNTGPQRNVSLK